MRKARPTAYWHPSVRSKSECFMVPRLTRRAILKAGAASAGLLTAPASVRAQPVKELTFYYPIAVGGPITKIIDAYCADFEKETGIRISPVYAGTYPETFTKAVTAIKGGSGPQFSVLLAAEIHAARDLDLIVPIEEIGNSADVKAWLAGFFPAFMANSLIDGKTWSIPFQRSTSVAFYSKPAFQEAGLDPERPPKTWAELIVTAKKITRREGDVTSRWGVKLSNAFGNAQWMFGALANQAGHILMNPAGTQTYFDHPKAIEAMDFWRSLAFEHGVTPKGVTEWGTLPADFMQGTAGIIYSTTGNLTNLRTNAKFPFGVMGLPGKEEPRTVVGGGNLYILKNANPLERAAALRFARWVTAPDRAADWCIKTGYLAVRPDAWETKTLRDYVAEVPAATVARDQLPVATGELSTYENQRVYKALADNVQACFAGTKTAAQAMKDTQAEADRILRPFAKD
jgi:sn-glycerol 3-phosphate transport system substrate-binding protein